MSRTKSSDDYRLKSGMLRWNASLKRKKSTDKRDEDFTCYVDCQPLKDKFSFHLWNKGKIIISACYSWSLHVLDLRRRKLEAGSIEPLNLHNPFSVRIILFRGAKGPAVYDNPRASSMPLRSWYTYRVKGISTPTFSDSRIA